MTVEQATKDYVATQLQNLFTNAKMRIKNNSGTVIADNIDISVSKSGTTILIHGETTLQSSDVPAYIEVYDPTSGNVYLTTTGGTSSVPAGTKVVVDWSVTVN